MNRKQLADELVAGLTEPAEVDKMKLSLASDLRWLVSEGYVIEFNDGSLDLPRTKVAPPTAAQPNESSDIASEGEVPPLPAGEESVASITQTIAPLDAPAEEREQNDPAPAEPA